jgi:polyisoprenoid-binding protein YceI
VAGYRVREKLGPVTAESDAVGRTEDVAGSAALVADGDALQVTQATFEVDVTTLTSDDGRRDNRIRSIGLESSSFPTATFELTAPVDVPGDALAGATVDVTLVGDLAIHGVTKTVTIPAQVRLVDGDIEVVGSLTFPFSDFGMTPPNIGGFVTVADDATLEFRIVLGVAA